MDLPSSDWEEGPGLLESIWDHKWLVVAMVVLGALVAYTWSVRQPVLYRGEVRLFVSEPPAQANGAAADIDPVRNVLNQAEFLTSPAVLRTAIRESGARLTPDQLEKRLTVEPAENADFITIQAVDSSPKGAAKLTNAVAAAYTQVLSQRARDEANGTIAELERAQKKNKADLAAIESRLRLQPNDPVLAAERQATIEEIRSVATRERDVSTSVEAAARSADFEKSPVPKEPFQPQPTLTALIGAMVGLVGGCSLAWWLATRSVKVRPFQRRAAAPVGRDLAVVRRSAGHDPEVVHGRGVSGGRTSPSDAAEADDETIVDFRQLTTSIQQVFRLLEGPGQQLYEQNVPQLVAEDIASRFQVGWVAVLLENGDGSLKVTGGFGLDAANGDSALHFDGDMQEVLDAGPRLVGAEEQGRLAKLGVFSDSAGSHLRVPLIYDRVGFGMLLVGQRGDDGDRPLPISRLDLDELAAQVRSLAPYLRAWVLLRSLRTRLRTFH
jgi:capsular polysaccharide biosynthesis protein